MSYAIAMPYSCPSFELPRGFSQEADYISQNQNEWERQMFASITFGLKNEMIKQLKLLATQCGVIDWDGYGALPITREVYDQSEKFICCLPLNIVEPTLAVDPNGYVSFEWYKSKSSVISISIGQDNFIHYAAIIGSSKLYGTEPFINGIPQNIMESINKVIQ